MKENAQSEESPSNTNEWNSSSVYICATLFLLFKRGHNTIQWINNLEQELCLSCVVNILEKLDNSTWVFHGKSLSSSLWDASACDFHKSLIILVTLVKQMLHCWAWELVVLVHVVVFGQNLVQEGFAVCCVQCSAMQCMWRKITDEIFNGDPCNLVFHTEGINFYIQDAFLLLTDPSFILF